MNQLSEKNPKSKYADAAVFKLYSYYYSTGDYNKAETYLKKLKKGYPASPYLKITDKNIPKQNDILTDANPVENNSSPYINGTKEAGKIDSEINKPEDENIYKYKIQAGAFSKDENAVSLNKNFIDAGYDSVIIQKTVGGTIFHVVIVGKFKTDDEAKSFLDLINSKFNLAGRIIPFDN